jgi:hypothetical protein
MCLTFPPTKYIIINNNSSLSERLSFTFHFICRTPVNTWTLVSKRYLVLAGRHFFGWGNWLCGYGITIYTLPQTICLANSRLPQTESSIFRAWCIQFAIRWETYTVHWSKVALEWFYNTTRNTETCWDMHWNSWRTFWALIITTLSAVTTNQIFPDTYWYGYFFLFWYVELVPKVCLHLSVTPCTQKWVRREVDTHESNMSQHLAALSSAQWVVEVEKN